MDEAMENLKISDEIDSDAEDISTIKGEEDELMPQLLDDVMIKIFENMDIASLRNHLQVREHREIIMSSVELMRKLPLYLMFEQWINKVHFMLNYGPLIKHIKATQCNFDTIQNFVSKIALCPNVEEIEIYGLSIIFPMEVMPNNIPSVESMRHISRRVIVPTELIETPLIERKDLQLTKLKRLSLNSSDHMEEFLDFFGNIQHLETLELTFLYQNQNQNFARFLTSQKQLETLELLGNGELMLKALFLEDISQQIKFKLKKLTVDCDLTYDSNFAEFLRNQKQIVELNMTGIGNNLNYHDIVFRELPNLRRLAWPVDKYLDDDSFRKIQQYRNTTLTHLRLHGYNLDPIYFRAVINIVPNMVLLSLENMVKFNVTMLESFESLRHIYVQNYRAETAMLVKFKQIEILEVQYLIPFGLDFAWINFMTNNPSLKILLIHQLSNFQTNDPIEREIKIILNSLRYAPSLAYCKIQRTPPLLPQGETEGPYPDYTKKIYKIYAEKATNSLLISEHIKNNCPDIMEILLEVFSGYRMGFC